jgi:hypothetical protein
MQRSSLPLMILVLLHLSSDFDLPFFLATAALSIEKLVLDDRYDCDHPEKRGENSQENPPAAFEHSTDHRSANRRADSRSDEKCQR